MEDKQLEENIQEPKKNKKILKISLLIIGVLAVIIGIVFAVLNGINKKTVGNTIGNIRNYGYAAEDNKYIYYMAPNKTGELKTISRINKKLNKESEELISGDWDITGINVYKNYIYFVTLAVSDSSEDEIDNKIHRMKIDGTEHKVINDNEFHDSCYEIYVVKDRIYYIGEDQGIYTMALDGSKREKIAGTSTGFVGITDKYIFYNLKEGQDEDEKIVTYMMDLDGTNVKSLTGERLYAVDIVGDELYYTDEDRHIFKVKIGETNSTMLSSSIAYCLNVTSDGIYYLKYIDEEQQALFKMDLDGNNIEKIKTLETSSTFLAVLENWVIYLDSTETDGIIAMVSKDGTKYQELYSLNYQEYIENLTSSDETETTSNEVDEESTDTTENVQ